MSSTGLFSRLSKTRQTLTSGLMGVFGSKPQYDESIFEDLEDQLLMADLGIPTTTKLLEELRESALRESIKSSSELLEVFRSIIVKFLSIEKRGNDGVAKPHVTLMVGVNGVGKTTTVAKIANKHKVDGSSVMMAACDTYRAAAVEQLQTWGQRLDIPVVAQSQGSDAAAVAYDAYQSAKSQNLDHLLIDTAGRLHTQGNLMEQLEKISRVLKKADPDIPHEVLITVDAGTGQNVISQVENFNQSIPVTGICVTKLDGTAKGGVVIALADRFGLPILYVGVGEGMDDLRAFDPVEFVSALIPEAAELDPV